MTPRPIYRWKSFWLGVILLLFLAWSWERSMAGNHWGEIMTPALSGIAEHARDPPRSRDWMISS